MNEARSRSGAHAAPRQNSVVYVQPAARRPLTFLRIARQRHLRTLTHTPAHSHRRKRRVHHSCAHDKAPSISLFTCKSAPRTPHLSLFLRISFHTHSRTPHFPVTAAAGRPAAAQATQAGKTGVRGNRCWREGGLAGRGRTRVARPAGQACSTVPACRAAGRSLAGGRNPAAAPNVSLCEKREWSEFKVAHLHFAACRFSAHTIARCAQAPSISARSISSKNTAHLSAGWG